MSHRPLAALGAALLSLTMVLSVSAADPGVATVREKIASGVPSSSANRDREPIIAMHPTDPSRIALVYPKGGQSPTDVLRISHDAGATWTSVSHPTGGGNHPMIAWGPGPAKGSARLYYMAMTSYAGRCCYFAISHSDNEGRTWSSAYIAHSTTPWFGGFPDLTVDNNPASPNYGVVYAAYNWPGDKSRAPGLRVLASSDYGKTYHGVEIPVPATPSGYGDTWRIDYRIRTAPDGAAYVAFYFRNLRVWNFSSPFSYGGASNVGRIGYAVARIAYHRAAGTFSRGSTVVAATLSRTSFNLGSFASSAIGFTDPMWTFGFDVDPATGAVYLAAGAGGAVLVYTSTDQGQTWTHRTLPAAPAVAGRAQYSVRPNIVAGPGFLLVTLHTIDKTSTSQSVGNATSVSFDGGKTWSTPRAVTSSRWRVSSIAGIYNGVGLRERAFLAADGGHVYFAYGDARLGYGRSAVYGAWLAIAPPPAPTPTPTATPDPTPTVTPDLSVTLPSTSAAPGHPEAWAILTDWIRALSSLWGYLTLTRM